jgi:hypothetical protein
MDTTVAEAIEGHHDEPDGEGAQGLAQKLWDARRIGVSLGVGDGVLPGGHDPAQLGEQDEETLNLLGGVAGLMAQLEWYRGAMLQAA